jgi:hypothetical protein
MLELFLKLIDRFIDLAKRREEVNRRFYTDFIAPAFSNFEAVHKNYIDTFLEYREMLLDGKSKLDSNHPVIELIVRDSLFSDNLRSKLTELIRVESNPSTQRFISAISVYLGCVSADTLGEEIMSPAWDNKLEMQVLRKMIMTGVACSTRYTLKECLLEILKKPWKEDTKRKRAIKVLDNLVVSVQINYSTVLREHDNLKKKLLTPK